MITSETIKRRFFREAFSAPLMDNTLRGLWCEYMVAEALGPDCVSVGKAWNPWDLQIGPASAAFPDRIRIQVKNSARLQTWNAATGKLSNAIFDMPWRRRPSYFEKDTPDVPCEAQGFLCDVFVMCLHPGEDPETADHRDPQQWRFFVLPVVGPNPAITQTELARLENTLKSGASRTKLNRTPTSLESGSRGPKPFLPLGIAELTIPALRAALGLA